MIMKEMASYKPLYARPAGPRAAEMGVFPFIGGQWEPGEDVKDTCAAADPFPVLLVVYMCMYVRLSDAVCVPLYPGVCARCLNVQSDPSLTALASFL